MGVVTLYDLGTKGMVKDIPPHLLPPEVWSEGKNFRMYDTYAQRTPGYREIFNPPSVTPGFIMHVPSTAGVRYWLYASLTAVYGYESGVHADITRAAGAYTATAYNQWNGCILGGIPILNNGIDVPQYWPTLSLSTDLANLTAWTSTLRANVIRNFGKYLVALNLNDNGTRLEHALQWSSPADPGSVPASWDITSASQDAGRTHLTDSEGGPIQDAALLGNFLVVYKRHSTHLMRYIGGNDVMGFEYLFANGAIAQRCVAIIDKGLRHFVAGPDNIFVHQGSKQITYPFDAKMRRAIYAELNYDNIANAFCFDDPEQQVAKFCYPASGATYPNKAACWNYMSNTCWIEDFDGMSVASGTVNEVTGELWSNVAGTWASYTGPWAQTSGQRRLIAASPLAVALWALNTGFPYGDMPSTAYLQRTGLGVAGKNSKGEPKADFTSMKLATRIWPKIRGSAVAQVRLGAQDEIDGAVTWATYQNYSPTQKYLDFEVPGRLLAVEILTTSDADCKIDGYDLEYQILGAH